MKVKGIIISSLFAVVFVIALINFGLLLAAQNNPSQSIANINGTNYSALQVSLSNTLGAANANTTNAYNATSGSGITTTGSLPFLTAIGGVWQNIVSTPMVIWNLISPILNSLLGSSAGTVVITLIATIITLTIIIAVVYLIQRGEGGN